MTIIYGLSMLAVLWLFFILTIPGITDWMAEILEHWAGLLGMKDWMETPQADAEKETEGGQ